MRLIWTIEEIEILDAKVGATVFLELEEMGVVGDAVVTGIHNWQAKPGDGNLVTGVFSHEPNNGLINIYVEGVDEPIGCTPEHLFWSADREEFVAAGSLSPSENVWTQQDGLVSVIKTCSRDGIEAVYNLTVHNQHVYEVTTHGVLVHNSYPTRFHTRSTTQIAALRHAFSKSGGAREQFLKSLAKNPKAAEMYGAAAVKRMSQGLVPRGMIVHHIKPLFRGGSNAKSNLTLMKASYHRKYFKELHFYE